MVKPSFSNKFIVIDQDGTFVPSRRPFSGLEDSLTGRLSLVSEVIRPAPIFKETASGHVKEYRWKTNAVMDSECHRKIDVKKDGSIDLHHGDLLGNDITTYPDAILGPISQHKGASYPYNEAVGIFVAVGSEQPTKSQGSKPGADFNL